MAAVCTKGAVNVIVLFLSRRIGKSNKIHPEQAQLQPLQSFSDPYPCLRLNSFTHDCLVALCAVNTLTHTRYKLRYTHCSFTKFFLRPARL